MAHIFAFQNIQEQCITEHHSFLKYYYLGVLEPLPIGYSGMAKKGDFRTKNVLKITFLSHSGTLQNHRFKNTRFQHILEPLLMRISRMAHFAAFQNRKALILAE